MRLNLFTIGDCTNVNTWSNLPYYFYQNLRAQSVAVRPVNLVPPQSASYRAFSRLMAFQAGAVRFIRSDYQYDPLRSTPYRALVNRRLRFTAGRHGDVDLNLFLTFTFSSYRYARVPVVHYCDRTYEHYLEETGRTPTPNDRRFIRIEQNNIENADVVLSTDQICCDFINSRYKPKRAFCLRPGISTQTDVRDPARLIAGKESSTDILFIGKGAYKRGVDILIRAFKMFNDRHACRFTLHIVGVQPVQLPQELRGIDPSIRFYGYLDRSIPGDLQLYDDLLCAAKIFVMPMRPGPFPGVIREVQLHCTPVIASNVSVTSGFLAHGHDSVLVDSLEPHEFAYHMDRLIHDRPGWRQLAWNGHVSSRNLTWVNTVEKFQGIIRESNLVKSERSIASPQGNPGRPPSVPGA